MCIERESEKVDFKSHEVNCLKECALALTHFDKFFQSVLNFGTSFTHFEKFHRATDKARKSVITH